MLILDTSKKKLHFVTCFKPLNKIIICNYFDLKQVVKWSFSISVKIKAHKLIKLTRLQTQWCSLQTSFGNLGLERNVLPFFFHIYIYTISPFMIKSTWNLSVVIKKWVNILPQKLVSFHLYTIIPSWYKPHGFLG
jgi:hypothetical protein